MDTANVCNDQKVYNIIKLQYLKSSLKGETARCIIRPFMETIIRQCTIYYVKDMTTKNMIEELVAKIFNMPEQILEAQLEKHDTKNECLLALNVYIPIFRFILFNRIRL